MTGYSRNSERNDLYINRSAATAHGFEETSFQEISKFHGSFPDFHPTSLVDISQHLAQDLSFRNVFLKDESNRMGLSSFKILGASWGTYKAILNHYGLSHLQQLPLPLHLEASNSEHYLSRLKFLLENAKDDLGLPLIPLELVTATDGNHGKAVARMASMLGIRSRIFVPVPQTLSASRDSIAQEHGAQVVEMLGDYDIAIHFASQYTNQDPKCRILVQDVAFDNYRSIPNDIVDGYTTLFQEIDAQLRAAGISSGPDLVVIPCGAGSFAQAGVRYFKNHDRIRGHEPKSPAILLVEPTSASSMLASLRAGEVTSIDTQPTVMAGLNCGTPSSTAFPDIQKHVDAVVTVTDAQALEAVEILETILTEDGQHIDVGPCGAAPLAALKALFGEGDDQRSKELRDILGLSAESTVVIVNTEGGEMYRAEQGCPIRHTSTTPTLPSQSVAADVSSIDFPTDPVILAGKLIRIPSPNPDLSPNSGLTDTKTPLVANESAIADYISAWFSHYGFEVHRLERTPGRPSVVGLLRGSASESRTASPEEESRPKSIMFNGHIDTVSLAGYQGDALSGEVRGGEELHGRGSFDMKGGLAAAMVAALLASSPSSPSSAKLRGDIIVAAVADEEFSSAGTQELIEAGWVTGPLSHVDAAIIPEPTEEVLLTSHQGFVWAEIDIIGLAAHGSRADLGVDAIGKAGHFLVAFEKYTEALRVDEKRGTAHTSLIKGGEEPSTYPAKCTVTVERRTVAGETPDTFEAELKEILKMLVVSIPNFKYELRMGMSRPPFSIDNDHSFVKLVQESASDILQRPVKTGTGLFWADSALLSAKGVPAVLFGPRGAGAHAATEWVSTQSVRDLTQILKEVVIKFCT